MVITDRYSSFLIDNVSKNLLEKGGNGEILPGVFATPNEIAELGKFKAGAEADHNLLGTLFQRVYGDPVQAISRQERFRPCRVRSAQVDRVHKIKVPKEARKVTWINEVVNDKKRPPGANYFLNALLVLGVMMATGIVIELAVNGSLDSTQ